MVNVQRHEPVLTFGTLGCQMLVPAVAVTPQTQVLNFLFGVKESYYIHRWLRNKNMLIIKYKNFNHVITE